MKLTGAGSQTRQDFLYDASGAIVAGGTPQLVLARAMARSYLFIQNNGADALWFEFGSARAHATLTGSAVTAVTVDNAGFGFSRPPVVKFEGGGGNDGQTANSSYLGVGQPMALSPSHTAAAVAVMTGSAPAQSVASITVTDGGVNYLCAPYVFLINSDLDPNGCAVPSAGNSGALFVGPGEAALIWNGTVCPTDQIAVFGAVTGTKYTVKYMT